MPDRLPPHGLQHTRPPCPSLSHRVCSSSCPLNRWCHPTFSSSVALFSFCLQSLPASRSSSKSWFFTSGGQSTGASFSAPVLPVNTQGWFSFRIDWFDFLAVQETPESLFQYHGVKASSRWCPGFSMVQLTPIHDHWKNHSFDHMDLCWQNDVSAFYYAV